jgi:acyl-coenzyme A synthetase/AMP-(fatty) acid ligase
VETLRRHLALRFEAVAVPRRWRFPPELPCDDTGKVTSRALASLFESPRP